MAKVQYFGKYRAKVQNVKDPEKRGRIRVLCPKVLGEAVSNWCEPCVPVAYNFGGDFAIPKVGETVWVEFEAGDVNKPVYTGGWWCTNGAPSNPYDVSTRYIEWNGCTIKMRGSDLTLSTGDSTVTLTKDKVIVHSNSIDLDSNSSSVTVGGKSLVDLIKEIAKQEIENSETV